MQTRVRCLAALAVACGLLPSLTSAQPPNSRERHIEPELNVQDRTDIWTMHFDFIDPRMMVVDIPGRGKKVVWYLIYRVVNRTDTPRTVIPDFEMVVPDKWLTLSDEVLPSVQEAIRQREDPTNRYNMQNSVTISRTPIPV